MGGDEHGRGVGGDGDADQRLATFVRRGREAFSRRGKLGGRDGQDVRNRAEVRMFLDGGFEAITCFRRVQGRGEPRFQQDAPGNGGVAVQSDDAVCVVGRELRHRRQWP